MQAMRLMAASGLMAVMLGSIGPVQAQVATEVSTLKGHQITLHLHDFLTPDDLDILRFVAKTREGLAMFVPESGGFAAMAVSPKQGFTQGGQPVASAAARSGLADAELAAAQAIMACQSASKDDTPCVVILEVAPKS
jgi:hypothetical protein